VQRSSSESVRTNRIYSAADYEESSLAGSRPSSTSMIPLLEVFCLLPPPQTTLSWQVYPIKQLPPSSKNSLPKKKTTTCPKKRAYYQKLYSISEETHHGGIPPSI
jgi:hypothetical protein